MPKSRPPVLLVVTDENTDLPSLWMDCSQCGREGEWYPDEGVVEHLGMEPCVVQLRVWRYEVAA